MTLTYNADGQRVAKQTTDGSAAGYLYDLDRLVHETDEVGGDVSQTYASSTADEFGDLLGEDGGGAHLYDARANTDALLDPAGQVEARYKYDAWGAVVAAAVEGEGWATLTADGWAQLTADGWAALGVSGGGGGWLDWADLPPELGTHMLAGVEQLDGRTRVRSLREITESFGDLTDKGTVHSYVEYYESLLEPFRCIPVTIVEVGVGNGASLAAWVEYFNHPLSRVIGIDVSDGRSVDSKAEFILGDATLEAVCAAVPACDIIVEDASHQLAEQTRTFSLLWPRLKPGGIYVIEDVQSDADRDRLRRWHPELVCVDRRHMNGRYDDVLMVARKLAEIL